MLTIAGALLFGAMTASPQACEALREGPTGTVTAVTDGDTVVLADGTTVRLVGTQAPKLPLGREGMVAWPLAEEAKAALEAMVLNKAVVLAYGGEEVDRHGRALAHLYVEGSPRLWVQQAMVTAGLARVYSFPDNRACLGELLVAEGRARAMKAGVWANPFYGVRRAEKPETVTERDGYYELVEGRVLQAAKASGRVFLNFGRHWKEDFTAVIDGRAMKLFTGGGLDPLVLEGALVRVRGWVDTHDGPRIEVTHPEQIEVLATR